MDEMKQVDVFMFNRALQMLMIIILCIIFLIAGIGIGRIIDNIIKNNHIVALLPGTIIKGVILDDVLIKNPSSDMRFPLRVALSGYVINFNTNTSIKFVSNVILSCTVGLDTNLNKYLVRSDYLLYVENNNIKSEFIKGFVVDRQGNIGLTPEAYSDISNINDWKKIFSRNTEKATIVSQIKEGTIIEFVNRNNHTINITVP